MNPIIISFLFPGGYFLCSGAFMSPHFLYFLPLPHGHGSFLPGSLLPAELATASPWATGALKFTVPAGGVVATIPGSRFEYLDSFSFSHSSNCASKDWNI